jgi:hypothetical protein
MGIASCADSAGRDASGAMTRASWLGMFSTKFRMSSASPRHIGTETSVKSVAKESSVAEYLRHRRRELKAVQGESRFLSYTQPPLIHRSINHGQRGEGHDALPYPYCNAKTPHNIETVREETKDWNGDLHLLSPGLGAELHKLPDHTRPAR